MSVLPSGSHCLTARLFATRPLCWWLLLVALAAGCSRAAAEPAPGDPARGEGLFASQACGACHTVVGLPGAGGQIGPDLSQVGAVAASRVPGQDAESYLRTALLFPNAFIVEGYPPNVMPLDYGQTLTRQQQRDLVAFLLSLH